MLGGTSLITSVSGNITVLGQGGNGSGTGNHGIAFNNGQITSTGSATISLTGIRGAGGSSSYGATGNNVIGGNSMTGNLTLIADDYSMSGLVFRTAGQFTLREPVRKFVCKA